MAFVRRKGNTYFLVHNVRRQGKVRQLHLARLGERPKITDDVVRSVSRNHPFLQLDWSSLREQVNGRLEFSTSALLMCRPSCTHYATLTWTWPI